ncbi:MAG: PKD domain-containing protein [Caldilineaceae bacterium]|nr:PKD domain-containing protein [Caldilineaceae bacterium]
MKTQLKRTGVLSVAVVLLLLLLAGVLLAAGETIARYNPGGVSGGGSVGNGTTTVRSAFGQPVVGVVGNANTTLCSGIACGMGVMSDESISGLLAENDGPTVLGNATGFSASVIDGTSVSYAWDYGDGTTGSGPNPSHVYSAVGGYSVTVTASNGTDVETAQTIVEVSNAVVEAGNFEFTPKDITIPQGGRVTWVRTDGTHNVRADDDSFTSGAPSDAWETYSRTFDAQGTYPYYCELHGGPGGSGMSGVVEVMPGSSGSGSAKIYLPVVTRGE